MNKKIERLLTKYQIVKNHHLLNIQDLSNQISTIESEISTEKKFVDDVNKAIEETLKTLPEEEQLKWRIEHDLNQN